MSEHLGGMVQNGKKVGLEGWVKKQGLAFQRGQRLRNEKAQVWGTVSIWAWLEFRVCWGKMGHEGGKPAVPGSCRASLRGLSIVLSEGAGEPPKVIGRVSIEARFRLQGKSLQQQS